MARQRDHQKLKLALTRCARVLGIISLKTGSTIVSCFWLMEFDYFLLRRPYELYTTRCGLRGGMVPDPSSMKLLCLGPDSPVILLSCGHLGGRTLTCVAVLFMA